MGFSSDFMSPNEIIHGHAMANRTGYEIVNTKTDYNFDKKELLLKLNKSIYYDDYISKFHCFEPNINGSQIIVDTIKKRFF